MSSPRLGETSETERVRPTRDGWAVLLFTGAALLVGLGVGDNLVLLVACALAALVVVDVLLGAWNLRGLEIARVVPAELFAGWEARGAFRVRNQRRWLAAVAVQIDEVDHPGAVTVAARADPGAECLVPVGWHFHDRGPGALTALRVHSAFPFGLTRRERVISLPATLLIYPRPRPGDPEREPDHIGIDVGTGQGAGIDGEFAGLREYRAGDPPRAIHWPTSARAGELMVAQRTGMAGERLMVRVAEADGLVWETALGRACGEVLRGFDQGLAVGLDLAGDQFPPRVGGHWRRQILDALAQAPIRETP